MILTNDAKSRGSPEGEMEIRDQSQIVRVPLGRPNAYIVISERQAILIDTGTKRNEQKIVQALRSLGLSPSDIRLIIFTHTHYDHCGSLKALKGMTTLEEVDRVAYKMDFET